MRALCLILLAFVAVPCLLPSGASAGPLKEKMKAHKEEHAHKHRMKKAAHQERKAQKEGHLHRQR